MSRNLSWKHGYRYCEAKNRKGEPCGDKCPAGTRFCTVHRKQRERQRIVRGQEGGAGG